MKENIRTIGIDDAAFDRAKSTKTFVFGIIVRGYNLVEGVLRTEISIDGIEATKRITSMIVKSKYHEQLRAIFLRSSTIAAFNIIDMNMLSKTTSIPVITVLSEMPDENDVKKALSNLPDWENRLEILNRNPPIEKIRYINKEGRECEVLIQQVGLSSKSDIKNILQISSYSSCIPECLRLADKIGQSFKDYIIK
ncbi:MAG: DUF99 family protein [Candidatus Heimdallarchaeota archaeon]|nr:DUF99 family protein [Candidatus Heimdallarchaeota archaeon]